MKKRTIIALICMGAAVYIYNTSALEESPTTEYGAAVMPVMPEMPSEPMAHPTEAEKMATEPAQTPEMVSGMPTEQPGGIEYKAPGVQIESPAAATDKIVEQGNAEMVPVPQAPTESDSQDDNDDIDQDDDEDDDDDDSLLDYTDFI